MFSGYLDTAEVPDSDLLIRTSGELRLSNYLMWQLAYTEFYFTDIPWPAFTKENLWQAIEKYNKRETPVWRRHRGKNNMFGVRLRSGIILVALALLTIISGGYVLAGTLLAISLIGLGELYRAARIQKKDDNGTGGDLGYLATVVYYGMLLFGELDRRSQ